MTDIIEAAEEGDDKKVRKLLKADPAQVFHKSDLDNTALHCAANQGQATVCNTLIEFGADVNARGSDGQTPLHAAVQGGAIAIAQALLQHGANLEAVDDRGQTPLNLAAGSVEVGRPQTQKLVDFLIQNGAQYDIDTAVLQADAGQVRKLLGTGNTFWNQLPLNKQATLLNTALLLKSPEILQLLLEHGADPKVRSTKGANTFAPISKATNPAMAELLLKYGADPSEPDFQGLTLLDKARKFKMADLEAVLLRHAGGKPPA